jgi:hypothetical protein
MLIVTGNDAQIMRPAANPGEKAPTATNPRLTPNTMEETTKKLNTCTNTLNLNCRKALENSSVLSPKPARTFLVD